MTRSAAPMSVVGEQQPPAPPARSGRALDLALRIAGGLVAVVAGALSGVLDLLVATWGWEVVEGRPDGASKALTGTSLWLGGVAAAVALTVVVCRFAHSALGTRWAAALPALPWFVLIFAGGLRTAEGDLGLAGDNLLGLAMIVAGAIAFAVMGFRQIVMPPPTR